MFSNTEVIVTQIVMTQYIVASLSQSEVFATRLQMTDIYMNQADDVDEFYRQIESSVTSVLDALAPLRNRTKRCGKRSSRWLSEKAVTAKRTRRQLERRWKRTGAESDSMA